MSPVETESRWTQDSAVWSSEWRAELESPFITEAERAVELQPVAPQQPESTLELENFELEFSSLDHELPERSFENQDAGVISGEDPATRPRQRFRTRFLVLHWQPFHRLWRRNRWPASR